MKDNLNNNIVNLVGEIASEFAYNHEVFGEGFYVADLKVRRISENFDSIPIMVSERMVDVNKLPVGTRVEISGQFRSYNRHDGLKKQLMLSVFVREIEFSNGITDSSEIKLDGYICKKPTYKKTPLGREITDILLAVNRPYGKSDYIPCICWGRNARYASKFEIGSHIQIVGRIQSREYAKHISETEAETRTAYEVSVSKIELIKEE